MTDKRNNGRAALLTGGIAAILAMTCCLGPLVLVILGFSGAWISNLTVIEPYRPFFVMIALISMFFSYRRIFRPVQDCKPGEICAVAPVKMIYKIFFWIMVVLVLIAIGFPYVIPFLY